MALRSSARRYWLGVGVVAAVLLVSMTTRPGTGTLLSVRTPLVGPDKWLHLLDYAVLASLLAAALRASEIRGPALRSWIGASLYGTALEALQWFLPHRTFAPGDVLANVLGAGIGAGLWCVALAFRRDR